MDWVVLGPGAKTGANLLFPEATVLPPNSLPFLPPLFHSTSTPPLPLPPPFHIFHKFYLFFFSHLHSFLKKQIGCIEIKEKNLPNMALIFHFGKAKKFA